MSGSLGRDDHITRATKAIAPAATTADLVVNRLEAPLLVGEALVADPEAVDEPDAPDEAEPELPLLLAALLETGGAGVAIAI